jgi:hypothetical protein
MINKIVEEVGEWTPKQVVLIHDERDIFDIANQLHKLNNREMHYKRVIVSYVTN